LRSSNRAYLPAVDHLRAAAAVLVVLFHGSQLLRSPVPASPSFSSDEWSYSANPLETLISEGHTGVALFMVLSGFILTTGALGQDLRYGTFIRNRLLRVGPLFVVVLLVAVAAASASFSFLGLLQTLFGFATLPGGFTAGPFAMILWTVGVEVQFYLLFPLFLRILDRRGPRPLVLFVLCMAVFRTLAALTTSGVDLHQLTYFSLAGRIDQFLIGMLAAWLFPRVRDRIGHAGFATLAGLVVLATLWAFNQVHGMAEPQIWRTVWVDVEALVWAMVILTYVSTARFGRGRISAGLAWTGERSYGLYLLHMPVIYLVSLRGWGIEVGGPVVSATVTALVLVLPCSIALATLSFAAIESPFLSLRRRYVAPPLRTRVEVPPHERAGTDPAASRRVPPPVPLETVGAHPGS
jgi:peptidoglycan/LPS O-acetylase OafA/YrhL